VSNNDPYADVPPPEHPPDERPPAKSTSGDPRPRVWKATDLDPSRRVEWLANRRIVAGAPNYMLGPEGIGKSLFLVWLTALVTTGQPFPQFGIPARAPQNVVLVLTEDDWSAIARPRLDVAGADLDFVRVICAEKDGSGSPTFPEDMAVIEKATAGAAAVIVDAWADTLPGNLSVKDPQQARQALHPWKELATRTGVTVLLSGHTNREKGGNVRNAYGLTGELRKKARMTILAQPDPDEDGVLVIGPEKSNVAAPVPASKFRIEAVPVFAATDDSDGTVPRLVWIGDAEQSAGDFFIDAAAAEAGEDRSERDEAAEWLVDYLAANGGTAVRKDILTAARAAGYSQATLKRAKNRAGVHHASGEFPRQTRWSISISPVSPPPTPRISGELTEPTGRDLRKRPTQSVQSAHPSEDGLTVAPQGEPARPLQLAPCSDHPHDKRAANGRCIGCIAAKHNRLHAEKTM
jgi:hypothetical protein